MREEKNLKRDEKAKIREREKNIERNGINFFFLL